MNHKIIIIIVACALCVMAFVTAGKKRQKTLPSVTQPTVELDTASGFDPLPKPGPDDWLTVHEEPGQTFSEFIESPRNSVDSTRRVIYLQPIWDLATAGIFSVEALRQFTESYFMLPVKILPPINPSKKSFGLRNNPLSGGKQVHAGMLMSYIAKRIPGNAYCVLGISMTDLYPDPEWNFVFGYASYSDRVGVFSFARYNPAFYDSNTQSDDSLLLIRSCKIIAHETGHMFGMAHCIYYHCVMNGCNHLEEADAQPIQLCPVCLKKLQYATGFDVALRYKKLEQWFETMGFEWERRWVIQQRTRLK